MYAVPRYVFILSVIGLALAVYVATSSIMAVGVTLTLIGIVVYVAQLIDRPLVSLGWDLNIVPVGSTDIFSKGQLPDMPGGLKEVFHISGNKYTYDEAPAVCAAYNAELATYEEVENAYAKGAEWCGYGWTMGGMALFPTQDKTWKKLQQEIDTKKKTRCGRPGINGGYFDPSLKLGVNCYGTKPSCNNRKYPIPIGEEKTDLINKYREESGKIKVSPFNRVGWSMWGMLS
jgi:hypothetical protein